MRPIRLKTCNFSIYLLNKKNLECGRTSIQMCYTHGFYIFLFNILSKKILIRIFFMIWSNLCFAGCFFGFKSAIFVLAKQKELRMRALLHEKVLYAGFLHSSACFPFSSLWCNLPYCSLLFPFQYFVQNVLIWDFFHDVGRIFLLLAAFSF